MNTKNHSDSEIESLLIEQFPSILSARSCLGQKDFAMAAEIYSEILDSAKNLYKEDSEQMCNIYLEYSHSLISASFAANYDKVQRLSAGATSKMIDDADDLEIAWNLLEICRVTFTALKNQEKLMRTHFLLGEVLLNNNKMEEAILEYEKSEQNDETLFRKALCYEFLGELKKCVELLKKIKTENSELREEIEVEIEVIEGKIENEKKEEVPKILKDEELEQNSDEEVIEIRPRPKK